MITWWSQWKTVLRTGKRCQREEGSPSHCSCGWPSTYEPSCETGALLCRIFLFSQFETTAKVIKVTMTFFFLGTNFWLIFYTLVSHNFIGIPEYQGSGGADKSLMRSQNAHGGRERRRWPRLVRDVCKQFVVSGEINWLLWSLFL